ncbi:MAG: AtpZ/AtpI family protein [Chloroflexi bacterium]|nr:MAG: AtpZ/AtpI family protein [Chloroflexota bacterium]TMD83264.1 MAG: AtpZ/AtpI family protein [Chloroflexota bacterium]
MAPKDKRKEPGMDHPTYDAAAPRGHAPSGGELAGLGLLLAVVVVLPLLIGAVIDGVAHTAPLLLLAGLVIGIIAGGAMVYTRFKRYL